MADITRLSLNQATTQNWSVREAVEGCTRHGIPSIALWRDKIAAAGLRECVKLTKEPACIERMPGRDVSRIQC